jgi:hypothetical protein
VDFALVAHFTVLVSHLSGKTEKPKEELQSG